MTKVQEYVAVEAGKEYKGGVGYRGPILEKLGFPVGPWGPAGVKIFIRQAKTVDSKKVFRIEKYIEAA